MSGFVDIHSHPLPGLDDGPAVVTDAIAMARAAFDAGTTTLVATPHLRSDFPDVHVCEIPQRIEELRQAIADQCVGLRLVSGAEVSLVWAMAASDEELRIASYDQRGTDLLIETPLASTAGLERLLRPLQEKGFRITLAHPERSADFQRTPERLDQLVSSGVLVQVNASSLLPRHQVAPITRLARDMCVSGVAHAIASDGHRAESWRPITALRSAFEIVAGLVGRERALWLTGHAPRAIVAGAELPLAPAIQIEARRRRMFQRA